MSKKLQQRAPVVHSSSTNGRHFLLQIHFLIISPVNDYEHEKFFISVISIFALKQQEARAHCDTWSPYAEQL